MQIHPIVGAFPNIMDFSELQSQEVLVLGAPEPRYLCADHRAMKVVVPSGVLELFLFVKLQSKSLADCQSLHTLHTLRCNLCPVWLYMGETGKHMVKLRELHCYGPDGECTSSRMLQVVFWAC